MSNLKRLGRTISKIVRELERVGWKRHDLKVKVDCKMSIGALTVEVWTPACHCDLGGFTSGSAVLQVSDSVTGMIRTHPSYGDPHTAWGPEVIEELKALWAPTLDELSKRRTDQLAREYRRRRSA